MIRMGTWLAFCLLAAGEARGRAAVLEWAWLVLE